MKLAAALLAAATMFNSPAHAASEQYEGNFNLLSLIAAADLLGDKECVKSATSSGLIKERSTIAEMLKERSSKEMPLEVRKVCGDALAVADQQRPPHFSCWDRPQKTRVTVSDLAARALR